MTNFHHGSCASFRWATMLQTMDAARLEFPPYNRFLGMRLKTGVPSVYQQPRRINLHVFSVHAKPTSVCTDTFAKPLSARAKVSASAGDTIHPFLPPPL